MSIATPMRSTNEILLGKKKCYQYQMFIRISKASSFRLLLRLGLPSSETSHWVFVNDTFP